MVFPENRNVKSAIPIDLKVDFTAPTRMTLARPGTMLSVPLRTIDNYLVKEANDADSHKP